MIIAPKIFKLTKLAAQEHTRYAVNGVNFERKDGKCFAAATDGRALGFVEWDDAALAAEFPPIEGEPGAVTPKDGFSCIVSLDDCERAPKGINKKAARVKAILGNVVLNESTANGTVTLATTDLERVQKSNCTTVDGHFPKWRDVVPTYKKGESVLIGVNPLYLRNILDVAAGFCSEESKGVTLEIPVDPRRPIVIRPPSVDGHKAGFVLMPVNLAAQK